MRRGSKWSLRRWSERLLPLNTSPKQRISTIAFGSSNSRGRNFRQTARQSSHPDNYFEGKFTAKPNGAKIPVGELRGDVLIWFPTGTLQLEDTITLEAVMLAAEDLPTNLAPGPDLIQSEIYDYCLASHKSLMSLLRTMLETAVIPRELKHFLMLPCMRRERVPRNAKINDHLPCGVP